LIGMGLGMVELLIIAVVLLLLVLAATGVGLAVLKVSGLYRRVSELERFRDRVEKDQRA
jgi:hypothetical protein